MSTAHPALDLFVARLLLRSALSADEQVALRGLSCRLSHVQPRCDIVSPGQSVSHACLIAKGLAVRFDQMRDGRRQIAAFHIPGDMCDLHSVVAPTAAWGIGTLAPTTVLYLPHEELQALAVRYPEIAMAFWRDATTDGSVLAKWVGNLGRQEAHARLAHLLCEMGMRMECAGLGTRTEFMLDASQEQLADALGLTAVHVNRTLQRLRAEGLIGSANRNVTILDWDGLAAVGEFDPAYLLLNPKLQPAAPRWISPSVRKPA